MKKQLILTSDGSHSFYIEEMDEQYHSKHGAINESMHIFINEGLLRAAQNRAQVNVLEVGMGTGLNVFLTYLDTIKNKRNVKMTTIEAFPISEEDASQLNYAELLGKNKSDFLKIHSCKWNEWQIITDKFSLLKYDKLIQEICLKERYDVIYFDAFAPEKQEELWTERIFQKLYEQLSDSGILVTYCVKGVIRRRLQQIGYIIEKIPGPKGGKREMLRAMKLANS